MSTSLEGLERIKNERQIHLGRPLRSCVRDYRVVFFWLRSPLSAQAIMTIARTKII